MSDEEATEIALGLVRHRMSREEFAKRCGLGLAELQEMLEGGALSDEVRGAYAVLEAGESLESCNELAASLGGEMGGRRRCWAGKAVINPHLLVVCFDDGETGMVRKKEWFKPRAGAVLEVEPSEESGMWRLVGDYRPNGVRLDVG